MITLDFVLGTLSKSGVGLNSPRLLHSARMRRGSFKMTIGILKLTLFIHGSNSLKEKRMVLHSLKARLRNNFNVAVTQIGDEDKWQRATLAIVGVERDKKNMNSNLCHIINFTKEFNSVDLIDHEMELI